MMIPKLIAFVWMFKCDSMVVQLCIQSLLLTNCLATRLPCRRFFIKTSLWKARSDSFTNFLGIMDRLQIFFTNSRRYWLFLGIFFLLILSWSFSKADCGIWQLELFQLPKYQCDVPGLDFLAGFTDISYTLINHFVLPR